MLPLIIIIIFDENNVFRHIYVYQFWGWHGGGWRGIHGLFYISHLLFIIYHEFLLHQGGVVMSSQIAHTHNHQHTPLAHILDICALIFNS